VGSLYSLWSNRRPMKRFAQNRHLVYGGRESVYKDSTWGTYQRQRFCHAKRLRVDLGLAVMPLLLCC
jgi:hypothetical protein